MFVCNCCACFCACVCVRVCLCVFSERDLERAAVPSPRTHAGGNRQAQVSMRACVCCACVFVKVCMYEWSCCTCLVGLFMRSTFMFSLFFLYSLHFSVGFPSILMCLFLKAWFRAMCFRRPHAARCRCRTPWCHSSRSAPTPSRHLLFISGMYFCGNLCTYAYKHISKHINTRTHSHMRRSAGPSAPTVDICFYFQSAGMSFCGVWEKFKIDTCLTHCKHLSILFFGMPFICNTI